MGKILYAPLPKYRIDDIVIFRVYKEGNSTYHQGKIIGASYYHHLKEWSYDIFDHNYKRKGYENTDYYHLRYLSELDIISKL